MNYSRSKIKPSTSAGFTLIELVLAMSIFSLILLMAYQALTSSAQAKLRVSQSVEAQSDLRSAYRTLSNAFDSRAQIKGDTHSIELDLTTADSAWLEGAKRIQFVIGDDQALWAYIDRQSQASRLFSGLELAEFRYIDGDLSHRNWRNSQRPDAVELSWSEGGVLRRWRFDTR